MVLRRLGRSLLSTGSKARRLSTPLLDNIRRGRDRLHLLPDTLATNGRKLAESNNRRIHLLRKVSQENNPRAKATRQPGPARTLLQVDQRTTRKARTTSNPATPLVQHQEGQRRARNIPRTDRPEVQTRHRIPEQILVETRNLQTPRNKQRRSGLVREPVRVNTDRDNQRHRLSPHGRRPDNHQLQRATERPDTDYEEVVQRPRGEVQPVQTRLHLLQQPLRGIRTWQRQRVPTTSRTSRVGLESNQDRTRTITEQHIPVPTITCEANGCYHPA